MNSSLDVKLRVDVNIVDRLCEELIKRCSTCVRVSLVTYSSLSIYHESRTEDEPLLRSGVSGILVEL